MRARIAIAVSLLALTVGLVVVLAERHPLRTGVNGIAPSSYVVALQPQQTFCQPATLPAGTRAVGLTVGVYGRPGPQLAITLSDPGVAVRSIIAEGYGGGQLTAPVSASAHERSGLLCIQDRGRSRLALAGVVGTTPVSTIDGLSSSASLEIEDLRGTTSGFGLATTVARRVGLLHLGSWVLWALVALMAAAAATAVGLTLREIRE